jgi:hypothetical protein
VKAPAAAHQHAGTSGETIRSAAPAAAHEMAILAAAFVAFHTGAVVDMPAEDVARAHDVANRLALALRVVRDSQRKFGGGR